ncbi:MAG: hypothetical protein GX242_04580 [Clostridiales bacterium]|nr:hypothetical protein [Clostridiales bacterium]
MAKIVDIMQANEGVIYKYIINTVKGNHALKSDAGKENYIEQLFEYENQNVCLIGYCILNTQVQLIVKGSNKKVLNNYIKNVNRSFYVAMSLSGYPFNPIINSARIGNKNLLNKINELHQFAPAGPAMYPYCSYRYLEEGQTDAVIIIKNASGNVDMSLQDFERAMNEKVKVKQKTMFENEPFAIVLEQVQRRYIAKSGTTSESNIIFIMAELCDRTRLSYNKVAAKMGISKKRRDILIGVVCDMVIRRNYTIDTVIAKLKLKKVSRTGIILEAIAELNRVYNYSYDCILSLLGINDSGHNLLAVLVKGICEQFNEVFETVCVKFHLQGDLVALRARCGY